MSGRRDCVRCGQVGNELGQRDNLDAADDVDDLIGYQTMFGKTDRYAKIGRDAVVGIDFTGIGIETGGKIDGEDESIALTPQLVDLAGGGANRFAQKMSRAEPEQAIEHDQRWEGP